MKKRRILLVNPWITDFAAYDLWAKPLGLLYIGKFLREYGYKIELLDFLDRNRWGEVIKRRSESGKGKYLKTIIPKPDLIAHIPRQYGRYGATIKQIISVVKNMQTPDAILVTSHMTYWYPGVFQTIRLLRKYFPGKPIILGGTYASLCPDHASQTIKPDYLITGYGEKKVLKLLDKKFNIPRSYNDIPEFNTSGIPPWDLYKKLDALPILTSRGCPFHCTYCATKQLNNNFVQHNPEDVINEIWTGYNKFRIKHFAFYDDALFFKRDQHIIPILKGIIDLGIKASFYTPNGLFAREINFDLAKLMRQVGFKTIRLSLESNIVKWQKTSSGKVTNANYLTALDNLEKAGYKKFEIETYLLMGLPEQKPEEVEESIRFVARQGAISRLASFTPIPGTVEWERAVKLNLIDKDIDPILTNNSVYSCKSEFFTEEHFKKLRELSNTLNQKNRNS